MDVIYPTEMQIVLVYVFLDILSNKDCFKARKFHVHENWV